MQIQVGLLILIKWWDQLVWVSFLMGNWPWSSKLTSEYYLKILRFSWVILNSPQNNTTDTSFHCVPKILFYIIFLTCSLKVGLRTFWIQMMYYILFNFFLFLERGMGERETLPGCLWYALQLGTEPAAQVCALTFCFVVWLSHTGQGTTCSLNWHLLWVSKSWANLHSLNFTLQCFSIQWIH